jgi:hypothetical protein
MADYDFTAITLENAEKAITYEVDHIAAHDIGDLVQPDGAIVAAIGNEVGGIIIRVGDARNKSLVLKEGMVRGVAGTAAAAKARIFSDGDGTASDGEPAGAAGTIISTLGHCISATRAYIKVTTFEKGAA